MSTIAAIVIIDSATQLVVETDIFDSMLLRQNGHPVAIFQGICHSLNSDTQLPKKKPMSL